ncbi:SDR family NAD(P)-dependent oxidoreductase [Caulobacter sp. CCNWLY153]|uniref:Short-chain dehydrogenase/reductase n=1 Tax=Caulobacter radicis TaxID=2172650 RepID=A0A2T9JM79_9CAUL|nr:SDR family NAD(P)-dependent oxidoreductase [Caulobacter radicis]PVM84790.1 short-chain dehydrogenase/reductase [Caulobacter radicis]
MSKVWFITGATRGIGAEIAKAVLADGGRVVATGRSAKAVEAALGACDRLLAVSLDVNVAGQPEAAVEAAIARFGRIDVLVNNAGYGLVGALEEYSPKELAAQMSTNLLGLAAVTKAVLPTLRAQKAGHIFNMSSAAGLAGFAGASGYSASKFAVEGLSESLAAEVAPLGVKVTIVEPGYFRTDFLKSDSVVFAQAEIAAYEATAGEARRVAKAMNGAQGGDPRKLAKALLTLAAADNPPLRFLAGADAVGLLDHVLSTRRAEADVWRDLSLAMALD